MHRRAAGILPVFLLTATFAVGETQTVPLFAPANDGIRQGFTRVVNLAHRDGTVTIRARDDAGVLHRSSFRIAASAVYHFNSDDLENGNAVKGITGIGNGTGDWQLALDSDLPIAVTAYLRTDDGFLTAMNNTVARGPDGVHRVMTFNPASNVNQESMLRLINRSGRTITVTVRGTDDQGAAGDRPVTVSLRPNGARTLSAKDLENGGLGDGSGKWRLLVTAPESIVVMSLMSTKVGYLTNLSSAPEGTTIPLFTAVSRFRQSFARIINRSPEAGTVTVRARDDSGTERGSFTIPIGANQVRHFNSDDLENGSVAKGVTGVGDGTGHWRLTVSGDLDLQVLAYMRTDDGFLTALHDIVGDAGRTHQVPILNPGSNTDRESSLRIVNTTGAVTTVTVRGFDDRGREGDSTVRITLRGNEVKTFTAKRLEDLGLGDGSGKWRLMVTATNPVILLSLIQTTTGHLTNLSYTPAGIRVIARPVEASFTYEEDDGIPFGIRFDATASKGDLTDYAWDFGENSLRVDTTTGTGPTPLFVYDSTWFFGRTRGDHLGYEGRYPATTTYPVTLTVTDRYGATDTHAETITVTNTLSFAGMRDLIGRITDGGHRGKLIISELGIGEAFEGSHAQQTVYVNMKEEGVPAASIVVHGPGITNPRALGSFGILTHPDNAALRAETLVVNLSVLPAFNRLSVPHIPAHNIIWVASAGNLDPDIAACGPTDPRIRDFWRSDHPYFSCEGRDRSPVYIDTMGAVRTGKVLMATAAVRRQDGTVVPDTGVMMCGDTREQCFAVEQSRITSASAPALSAAVFHLFQTYEDAEDVVHALKSCATDIGEPGVDREFGQGLVDFRCAAAMLPVVDR